MLWLLQELNGWPIGKTVVLKRVRYPVVVNLFEDCGESRVRFCF